MTPAAIALTSRIRHLAVPGYGDDEVAFIADTIAALRPTHVFDWGTNVGSSCRIWWESCTAKIVTVEHPDHSTHDHPGNRYALWCEGLGPRVKMLWGDGVEVSLAEFQAADRPQRALFFLDGDHSYKAVTRELDMIARDAPDAVILVHDTNHKIEDTEAAAEDFLERNPRYDARWLASQAGMVRLWPNTLPSA